MVPGAGRVILATISHLNNDLYEVGFAEGGAVLRGTGAHPLYSLDRDDWVQIRDLQVGERLQTADGAVTVEALEKVRGLHRVYNLEVEGDHEYLVGEAGVRAHNSCAKGAGHNGVEGPVEVRNTRTTRAGDPATRIRYPDGSVKDISPSRTKEFVPNTHPKAPPGRMQRVKFDKAQPGSKGFKRDPTQEELDLLDDITK